jgi:DNA-binding response OmpR family regulator
MKETKKRIIVVDDEKIIVDLVTDVLENDGFNVISADSTVSGENKIIKLKPDLALLDVEMPVIGGIELCRKLRANPQTKTLPIIFLTASSSVEDKVKGLEVGGDDYVTKPFSSQELIARISALLRRIKRKGSSHKIECDGLSLEADTRKVFLNKKEIRLRPKEFDLLCFFLQNQGIVMSKEYILEMVFGYTSNTVTRTLDTHIKNLRYNLGKWGDRIKTVFGEGFTFSIKHTK